jgi:hippurate hydrolase
VTVGSVHGGTKHNIIPDEVHLQLTVRSYKPEVRKEVLASIRRIALHTARAADIPEELLPVVKLDETEFTPATYNDPALTERLVDAFSEELGQDRVMAVDPVMAGEDFSRYSLGSRKIPSLLFWLGTVDAAGGPLHPLHSSAFAPSPGPTIRTGVRAMTAAVLDLMKLPRERK